jgi:hypothetical protein
VSLKFIQDKNFLFSARERRNVRDLVEWREVGWLSVFFGIRRSSSTKGFHVCRLAFDDVGLSVWRRFAAVLVTTVASPRTVHRAIAPCFQPPRLLAVLTFCCSGLP